MATGLARLRADANRAARRLGASPLALEHTTARADDRPRLAYRRYDHLFGSLTYGGLPVFGFQSTSRGATLDAFGRNIYVDTLDSVYGGGRRCENSFLTHRGRGTFCYGFYPHGSRPPGTGTRYRATVIGPGVTPDVTWEGAAPGPYNHDLQQQLAGTQLTLVGSDPLCRPV